MINIGPNPIPNNRPKKRTRLTVPLPIVGPSSMQPMQFSTPNGFVVRRLGKRPIDKALINVMKNGVDGTQVSTTLATTSNACTITGLRWAISFQQDGGAGGAQFRWAIVVVRDGNSANTMSSSDAGTFYEPEQDVLTFGVSQIDANTQTKDFNSNTKTMRKMLIGDQLVFIASGVATNTVAISGVVQFFCKS